MAEYISMPDFARMAGVSRQAVHKRVDRDLQPFMKEVDGKKLINTNALPLFKKHEQPSTTEKPEPKSEQLTATNEQPASTSAEDKLIQSLEKQVDTLSNQVNLLNGQLSETVDMLKEERDENRKLTDQLITLSNDFSNLANQSNLLASQAQSLQGHIQKRTLGDVDAQIDDSECKPTEVNKTVDEPKKKGFFSKIFG